ncbi:hypothetical protein BK140_01805 [Paenibacillus macerans]|nr:hypothetical protein BK140_01805 [Paenibacillus macerans]
MGPILLFYDANRFFSLPLSVLEKPAKIHYSMFIFADFLTGAAFRIKMEGREKEKIANNH